MVDLYGLPEDFPGYAVCAMIMEPRRRVESLEEHFARDVEERLGDHVISRRLIPYIQFHEFETLLFADPSKFLAAFPDQNAAVDRL